LVGGKDFRELSRAASSKDTSDRNHAQAQLTALFRIEPQTAREAEDAILHGDLDANAKKRISAALGAAGTPQAQHALADVIGSSAAPAARKIDAAIALAQTASPTLETAAALDDAMGSPDPGVSST